MYVGVCAMKDHTWLNFLLHNLESVQFIKYNARANVLFIINGQKLITSHQSLHLQQVNKQLFYID